MTDIVQFSASPLRFSRGAFSRCAWVATSTGAVRCPSTGRRRHWRPIPAGRTGTRLGRQPCAEQIHSLKCVLGEGSDSEGARESTNEGNGRQEQGYAVDQGTLEEHKNASVSFGGARTSGQRVRSICASTPAHDTDANLIRDFATDRAVRTIIYYLTEFRDEPARRWLLDFDDYGKWFGGASIGSRRHEQAYHFLRNTVEYLSGMMSAPSEMHTMVVGTRIRREFTFTLEPFRYAQRIMAARESIAEELRRDLGLVSVENSEILSELVHEQSGQAHQAQRILDHDDFTTDESPLRYHNYRYVKALLTRRATVRFLNRLRFEGRHAEHEWLSKWPRWEEEIGDGDDFIRSLLRLGNVRCEGQKFFVENHDRVVEREGVGARTEKSVGFMPSDFVDELLILRSLLAREWRSHLAPEKIKEEHLTILRSHLKRSMPNSE
ncbi:hypothetical protein CYME_CMF092C [Cyanidioschyzon merolae strain 10D]|uniref:Uncharacterized protein n=1 Tax=Cyanidioschyzon merolae (strain NIES-3377 / 10D) TaxID=280699 RepID=M1V745_CYAM1|nr:hypothetical protein CYME_CMF092C [Cyanidioschyzon merolae strain 10D]BAM79469.1 hypothetical protein CYME_CMF092C [Cyanidioschyzon merolae strain 10D]|eukprot:XP_005535755.1 hypothetical protein CYME_CMF092C [Cyanidioschyzon merolae strain 10D]